MTLTATTLRGIEIYLAVGILYFVIYRVLLTGVQWFERRHQIPGMETN
jgi:polar amino acid transport system permease protein